MNFVPQDTVNIAVLYKLFLVAQESEDYLTAAQIAVLFDFPIGPKRVDIALENLERESWIIRRATVSRPASITPNGYKTIEQALMKSDTLTYQYAKYADDWLQLQRLPVNGFPAADRIVKKTDNSDAINAISNELSEIERLLGNDNEVGSELGDDRDLIQGELSAAKELIKKPKFRLQRVLDLVLPALKYLGEKFSGASIGEAAKHLIKLLLELI